MKFKYERINAEEGPDGEPILDIPESAHVVSLTAFGGSVSAKCLVPLDGDAQAVYRPLFEPTDGEGNAP